MTRRHLTLIYTLPQPAAVAPGPESRPALYLVGSSFPPASAPRGNASRRGEHSFPKDAA